MRESRLFAHDATTPPFHLTCRACGKAMTGSLTNHGRTHLDRVVVIDGTPSVVREGFRAERREFVVRRASPTEVRLLAR